MLFHQLSLDPKCEQLKRFLNPKQLVEKLKSPYLIHVFIERVQYIVTMISQVLGLDNDMLVGDVILGFLMLIFSLDGIPISKFKFGQFLVENIHVQLVSVHTLKYFRQKSYLMPLFFHFNQVQFQDMDIGSENQPKDSTSTLSWSLMITNDSNSERIFNFINKVMDKDNIFCLVMCLLGFLLN